MEYKKYSYQPNHVAYNVFSLKKRKSQDTQRMRECYICIHELAKANNEQINRAK